MYKIAKTFMIILPFLTVFNLKGQEQFIFSYNKSELNSINEELVMREHFLGNEIARKLRLFEDSYTYMQESDVSQLSTTVVEKPSIYYSVKKMEKFYKKAIKAGTITVEDATAQFDHILKIALNIRHQETDNLEDILWKVKEPIEIATLYQNNIQLNN